MSLKWSSLFTLISWYFTVMCFNVESPCSSSRFYGFTSYVCGVIGKSINLTCNVSTKCDRGFWKHDNTTNRTWLMPGTDVGPNYHLRYIPSQALNSLLITNISNSLAGVYTCLCDDNKQNQTAFACFNVSMQCDISVQINNENRVFDRCNLRSEAVMVTVKMNNNITIKCNEGLNRTTNCSRIGNLTTFTVEASHHLCSFHCRPRRISAENCEVNTIGLNVVNKLMSTFPSMELYTENFSPTDEWLFLEINTATQLSYPANPVWYDTDSTTDLTYKTSPDHKWININLLHILVPSSVIFVVGIAILSIFVYVLFYKLRVSKSSSPYPQPADEVVYHDIQEMKSDDFNLFRRHVEHQTNLDDNDYILSDAGDIRNAAASFQVYEDVCVSVSKGGHDVSVEGTVLSMTYHSVQKSTVDARCPINYSTNSMGEVDTYTGMTISETHNNDDTERCTYTFVDKNAMYTTLQ